MFQLFFSKLWFQEIVGNDGDLGIEKDLTGQKQIWPLDLQVDDHGKVTTILVATFCKDRFSSSSYIQYSLLTMQYMSKVNISDFHETVLEKKAPIQVIIPKARVEDEDFLFSMRLRVGKVLDASVLPPIDDEEDGDWVVLIEKAGIWAIPIDFLLHCVISYNLYFRTMILGYQ
ncbi:hypothetical protein F3Y22_tig00110236pilonHSYRG00112 [Hibiscus syriacus]|uniref:Nucleoporin Nup133/Nup155-like N-terminal domain-containing protein n=1 Tax=Hibiscus syriacus TaxID=106335 RepID=A0A6A3BC79_HIBSY|nr:hypothetical protein F3Y22_tig00110236pilonHSYRG00112 [Hibiscus syriacus]